MFTPLTLPNGSRLTNRLAKAALEENLADEGQLPGPALWRLYRHWGIGGAGLIITGNVMIDGRAMTGPGGVVLEQDTPLASFETWAKAARQEGAQVWMQLSHPGRQVMADMGGNAWAPSAIPMAMGKYSKAFAQPEAMSEAQIAEVIARFAASAHAAERAGFTGVQIHTAHGYLISQFLSPLANQRSDRWGGELANRARLLLEVVRAVRKRVSPGFCVAVKLNSADFQRGGFSPDEARQVLLMLNELPVDLVELSGGSYESPAMQGATGAEQRRRGGRHRHRHGGNSRSAAPLANRRSPSCAARAGNMARQNADAARPHGADQAPHARSEPRSDAQRALLPAVVAAHRSVAHPPHSAALSCLVTATLMTAAPADMPAPHKNPAVLIALRKICKKSPLWVLRF